MEPENSPAQICVGRRGFLVLTTFCKGIILPCRKRLEGSTLRLISNRRLQIPDLCLQDQGLNQHMVRYAPPSLQMTEPPLTIPASGLFCFSQGFEEILAGQHHQGKSEPAGQRVQSHRSTPAAQPILDRSTCPIGRTRTTARHACLPMRRLRSANNTPRKCPRRSKSSASNAGRHVRLSSFSNPNEPFLANGILLGEHAGSGR